MKMETPSRAERAKAIWTSYGILSIKASPPSSPFEALPASR